MNRISPTSDLGFKKVLASIENTDILIGFISDFFNITPTDVTIENPYSIKAYKELLNGKEIEQLRQTLRDVSASFATADFSSEVQIQKTRYFDERSIYYPLDRYCQNYNKFGKMELTSEGKQDRYSSLRPVYAMNILGYTHFQDQESLRIFELYDPVRKKGLDKQLLKIGYFELTKELLEN